MDAQEKSVQGHAGSDARMETLPSSGRGKEEKEGGREGGRGGGETGQEVTQCPLPLFHMILHSSDISKLTDIPWS